MQIVLKLFTAEFVEALGWALLHSLWQGAIVAVVLGFIMLLMKKNSAQIKYLVSYFSLLIIVGWSVNTFVHSYRYALEKAQIKNEILHNPDYIRSVLQKNTTEAEIVTQAAEIKKHEINYLKIRSFFQRNFSIVVAIWFIGLVLLAIRMITGFLYTRKLKRRRLVELEAKIQEIIAEYANRLNIRRKVEAFLSPLVKTPVTFGTFKPLILFPIATFTGLSTKDVEAIIAHELAHIVRHDYLFNIFQSIIETLFFYHPAVWMISRQIRNERENSCDNIAINITGDKNAYIKSLAKVQISQMEHEHLAMAFAASKGGILQRIKRLQTQVAMNTNFTEKLIAIFVVAIGLTLVSFTMSDEQFTTDQDSSQNENYMLSKPDSTLMGELNQVKIDSLKNEINARIAKGEIPEESMDELEKVLEVAMSEANDTLSAQMMFEIQKTMSEIDIAGILNNAFKTASEELSKVNFDSIRAEVRADIDMDEFHREMESARTEIAQAKEEMRRDLAEAGIHSDSVNEDLINFSMGMASMGIEIASSVIENLPIEDIVDISLSSVESAFKVLGEINFDSIAQAQELSKEDLEKIKKQLEDKEKQLEKEKKKLKELEKELNKN